MNFPQSLKVCRSRIEEKQIYIRFILEALNISISWSKVLLPRCSMRSLRIYTHCFVAARIKLYPLDDEVCWLAFCICVIPIISDHRILYKLTRFGHNAQHKIEVKFCVKYSQNRQLVRVHIGTLYIFFINFGSVYPLRISDYSTSARGGYRL